MTTHPPSSEEEDRQRLLAEFDRDLVRTLRIMCPSGPPGHKAKHRKRDGAWSPKHPRNCKPKRR